MVCQMLSVCVLLAVLVTAAQAGECRNKKAKCDTYDGNEAFCKGRWATKNCKKLCGKCKGEEAPKKSENADVCKEQENAGTMKAFCKTTQGQTLCAESCKVDLLLEKFQQLEINQNSLMTSLNRTTQDLINIKTELNDTKIILSNTKNELNKFQQLEIKQNSLMTSLNRTTQDLINTKTELNDTKIILSNTNNELNQMKHLLDTTIYNVGNCCNNPSPSPSSHPSPSPSPSPISDPNTSSDPSPSTDTSPNPRTTTSPNTSPSPSYDPSTSPSPSKSSDPSPSPTPISDPNPSSDPSPSPSSDPSTSPSTSTSPSPSTSTNPDTTPRNIFLTSNTWGNHMYYISIVQNLNVTSFQETCELNNGYLAEIESQEEYDFLTDFFTDVNIGDTRVYLGITDAGDEGNWHYMTSGTPLQFESWQTGQPDGGTGSNCVFMKPSNGKMYDGVCVYHTSWRFLCEVPLTP